MHKESANNDVDNWIERKSIWSRYYIKEQKGSITIRHKATYIKAANPIKITEIEEPSIEKSVPEVEIIREAEEKVRIVKSKNWIKEEKEGVITVIDEAITLWEVIETI